MKKFLLLQLGILSCVEVFANEGTLSDLSEKAINSEIIPASNVLTNEFKATDDFLIQDASLTQQDKPFLSASIPAHRDSVVEESLLPSSQSYRYTPKVFSEDIKAIKWDAIGAFAGITALGFKSWKWGNTDFHFHDEKWFGKDRSSIGMDKLGHAFTSYTMTNLFAEHLQRKGRSPAQSAISAALLTQALMLYVETFDGFSTDHGFAYEDVIMNLAGTSLAYARQRYPKVKDLIDYRMEYSPSGYSSGALGGFRPVSDYAGQKYHLVLKLGGFKALKDTPFKYVELNAGYYARGFTKQEEALNIPRTRTSFVGIGLNLSQLFFGERSQDETLAKVAGRDLFEHIQLPTYTKVYKNKF